MAFFPGAVGVIYQQFSLTMGVSILFSGFLARSLTPALCATFLKPVEKGHHHAKRGFFGWFNRGFDRASHGYGSFVARTVGRAGRYMAIYLALLVGLGWAWFHLAPWFLPHEEPGGRTADMHAECGADANVSLKGRERVER